MTIKIQISTQPDDETCGPTSLHALYHYYGHDLSLNTVIKSVRRTKNGGTLASLLGIDALSNGFNSLLYVHNLDIFDPSWFNHHGDACVDLCEKLTLQCRYSKSKRFIESSKAYIQYLKKGGVINMRDLSSALLKQYFNEHTPILCGLSATYLYQSPRERQMKKGRLVYDDIRGEPSGHFVVLCGYDEAKRHVVVADPHGENPLFHDNFYKVGINRLINSIMLGVLTFDSDLLIIQPKEAQ